MNQRLTSAGSSLKSRTPKSTEAEWEGCSHQAGSCPRASQAQSPAAPWPPCALRHVCLAFVLSTSRAPGSRRDRIFYSVQKQCLLLS